LNVCIWDEAHHRKIAAIGAYIMTDVLSF